MRWTRPLIIAGCMLALPVVMTSSICYPRFLWHWNASGQCGASDPPSEVFMSFAALSIIIALMISIIWVALSLIMRAKA